MADLNIQFDPTAEFVIRLRGHLYGGLLEPAGKAAFVASASSHPATATHLLGVIQAMVQEASSDPELIAAVVAASTPEDVLDLLFP